MFKESILIVVAVLIASTPAGAQQSSVWSATVTAGEAVSPQSGNTLVGYIPGLDAGEVSDLDFDFRGTTHSINHLWQYTAGQRERVGTLRVGFSPAMDDQDLESLMFTADGQQLTVASYAYAGEEDNPHTSIIALEDPGFRWTVDQRIAVGLTVPDSVPALPLAAAGLLALLLGSGAYRRRRVAGRS